MSRFEATSEFGSAVKPFKLFKEISGNGTAPETIEHSKLIPVMSGVMSRSFGTVLCRLRYQDVVRRYSALFPSVGVDKERKKNAL